MLALYIDHSSSAVKHTCALWQAYLVRAYASNMKCMYTNIPGKIVDCSDFI